MVRLTINVTYSRRSLVAYACVLVCLLAGGLVAFLARPSQAQPAPQAVYMPRGAGRHLYITESNYYPDQALTACGPGYHMASLWEILDTSNWVYDYDHPAAHVQDDSGYGPPSHWYGWIRTGYYSSGEAVAGTGNCQAWTSRSSSDVGTLVRLSRWWEIGPGEILTWTAYPCACDLVGPVWCVADVEARNLPLVLRAYP